MITTVIQFPVLCVKRVAVAEDDAVVNVVVDIDGAVVFATSFS